MNHQCVSKHYKNWVLGIMIYKGILLLFGVFLAWETRNVHYAELNDSKNIGVAVYNILLFSVLSITTEFVLSNFLAKRIFNNSLIFVCTTMVLGLVFLPKVLVKHTFEFQVLHLGFYLKLSTKQMSLVGRNAVFSRNHGFRENDAKQYDA